MPITKLFTSATALKSGLWCKSHVQVGFYPYDIYNQIHSIKTLAECALICLIDSLCRSASFVHESSTCFTSRSNMLQRDILVKKVIKLSLYIRFECEESKHNWYASIILYIDHFIEPSVPITVIPSGHPTNLCGTPAFPTFSHDSIFAKRRKRVYGGSVPPPYSQPWYGLITTRTKALCGMSLVAKSAMDFQSVWAVTAAHCFYEPGNNGKRRSIRKPYIII